MAPILLLLSIVWWEKERKEQCFFFPFAEPSEGAEPYEEEKGKGDVLRMSITRTPH